MDREANLVGIADIEIGMGFEKRFGFRRRRLAKAVDIMMAVALGVRNADQRAKRQILLHAEAGLAGQILAGDESLVATFAPFRGAGGVDDGLVDTLAGFRRDAAIAERARRGEAVIRIIR